MDGEVESGGRALPSVALGMVLLAGDQVRAILESAREQLQQPPREPADSDPPTGAGGGGLRQPLIGAVFDLQRQAVAAGVAGARRGNGWLRGARRTAVWAWQAPPLGGLRVRVEAETSRLTRIGASVEAETARLARIGAAEEARARQLAAAAVDAALLRVTRIALDVGFEEAYRRAIARMLETPEIADLVREQSASMAQELAELVRARAISADDVVERLVGRVLRRSGGTSAPPPPPPPPAALPSADGVEA